MRLLIICAQNPRESSHVHDLEYRKVLTPSRQLNLVLAEIRIASNSMCTCRIIAAERLSLM